MHVITCLFLLILLSQTLDKRQYTMLIQMQRNNYPLLHRLFKHYFIGEKLCDQKSFDDFLEIKRRET